jgi:hypothetical protein
MPVAQSSHLQEYEYDAASETLTVQFQNGSVYQYSGVPMDRYEKLRQSGGSGTVFHSEIRGRYAAAKLADPGREKK